MTNCNPAKERKMTKYQDVAAGWLQNAKKYWKYWNGAE